MCLRRGGQICPPSAGGRISALLVHASSPKGEVGAAVGLGEGLYPWHWVFGAGEILKTNSLTALDGNPLSQSLNKWTVYAIWSDRESLPGPVASLKSRLVPYLATSLSSQGEGQMGQGARRVPAGPECPSCGPWLANTLPVCRRVLELWETPCYPSCCHL